MYQKLIKECREGKRLAQNELYKKFYGKMLGVCLRYARDREEAVEMLNAGYFKVFKTIKNFDEHNGNLEGWIYRIMVNTAIDHYRREARHRTIELGYWAEDKEDSGNVISDMSAEEILGLVQKLSPAYRTVFNLYVIEGYSHREIGDLLDIAEGTSKSNLAKARARLQQMIKALEPKKTHDYVGAKYG